MKANKFKFEKGTQVIATMINGDKLPGVITERQFNHFNGQNYYTIKFNETYALRNKDGMPCVPEYKIELA